MKSKKLYIVVLLTFLVVLSSCSNKEVSREYVGKVVDVVEIRTSVLSPPRTLVRTSRDIFIVMGVHSAMIGQDAYLVTYSLPIIGRIVRLCLEGRECYKVFY